MGAAQGVRVAVGLVLLVALSACSKSGAEHNRQGLDADAEVLRVAMRRLPPAMADISAHSGQPSIDIWPAFLDALTFIDADGVTQPWLATQWRQVADTTWHFSLRTGVRFSNGEPFDADAVLAAVDHVLFGYGASGLVRHSLLPTVSGAEVIDTYTVAIHTYEPDPLLPTRVAQFYPLPPQYFEAVGPQEFARKPIGTGPFVVEEWGIGKVALRANPTAWNPPQVKKLEFLEIPDITARRQAIVSHQVHIAQYLAPDDVADLKGSDIRVIQAPEPRLRMIVFVVRRDDSPLRLPEVRLALNHAVNKRAIVSALLADAPVATQIGTRAMEGFDPGLRPLAYDPERARELLAAAGYADGLKLEVDVLAVTNTDRLVFEAVAADIRDIGVDLKLNTIEFERWRANLLNGNWRGDMFTWSVAIGPLFDISRAWQYLSCRREHPPFCQPPVSALIEERTGELDPVRRRELMKQANQLIRSDPPTILLHELMATTGLRGVDGYEVHNLIVRWDKVALAAPAAVGGESPQ